MTRTALATEPPAPLPGHEIHVHEGQTAALESRFFASCVCGWVGRLDRSRRRCESQGKQHLLVIRSRRRAASPGEDQP